MKHNDCKLQHYNFDGITLRDFVLPANHLVKWCNSGPEVSSFPDIYWTQHAKVYWALLQGLVCESDTVSPCTQIMLFSFFLGQKGAKFSYIDLNPSIKMEELDKQAWYSMETA